MSATELGPTLYRWRPDVSANLQSCLNQLGPATGNTYRHHPRLLYRLFPGVAWSRLSYDIWGPQGRGDPLPIPFGVSSINFHLGLSAGPRIRHMIWRHALWTSWGGWSVWNEDDHSGELRHFHVTYWPD